jgi:hypothetical protein
MPGDNSRGVDHLVCIILHTKPAQIRIDDYDDFVDHCGILRCVGLVDIHGGRDRHIPTIKKIFVSINGFE